MTSAAGIYAIATWWRHRYWPMLRAGRVKIAVEHMAGHSGAKSVDINAVPGAVYTEPEVASFGLTTEKAVLKVLTQKK